MAEAIGNVARYRVGTQGVTLRERTPTAFLGEAGVSGREQRSQILLHEVARAPNAQAHIGNELIDVVCEEWAQQISLRAGRQDIGQPSSDTENLGLHLVDG